LRSGPTAVEKDGLTTGKKQQERRKKKVDLKRTKADRGTNGTVQIILR
jgi:hypothetical protein